MKRILFNATHAEELRVAIVDGQKLIDLDLESAVRAQKKGNIYKCIVTRVEPSLEAAFVNYGADRHGFLPFKEIYRGYFQNYSSKTPLSKVSIKDVIKEGQELIVQVEKDERSNKGAALTTFISLAGRFLVLMPNNPKGGGISRRVEGPERTELKRTLDALNVPSEHAIIARTAALSRTEEELKWDFEFLIQLWDAIEDAATQCTAPTLIYQESNLIVRAIRDYLNANVQEVMIDDKEIYERAHRFVQQVMPQNLSKIKFYEDPTPLYSRYQIESQIASAFSRDVQLPSGGSIVIDHTEALISVDVNSARATKGSDIEETALQTNLEAVEEIARQLRIRDIGGLVVLDLIDMGPTSNQRKVEAKLKDALSHDRARVQVGRISRFGLLEMSRQRIRSSIDDANYHTCPRCEGTGHIRSIISNSLNLLRLIEEEALKENTESLQVFLPIDSAAYLLNEKRRELSQLESRLATRVTVIPTTELQSPHFQIKRLRSTEIDEMSQEASHQLKPEVEKEDLLDKISAKPKAAEKPMIGFEQMTPSQPPPSGKTGGKVSAAAKREAGLIGRLWGAITGSTEEAEAAPASRPKTAKANPAKRAPRSNTGNSANARRRPNPRNTEGQKQGQGQGQANSGSGGRSSNRGGRNRKNSGPNNRRRSDSAKTSNATQHANTEQKVEAKTPAEAGEPIKKAPNRRAPANRGRRDDNKPNSKPRSANSRPNPRKPKAAEPKPVSDNAGNVISAPSKAAAVASEEPNGNVK